MCGKPKVIKVLIELVGKEAGLARLFSCPFMTVVISYVILPDLRWQVFFKIL